MSSVRWNLSAANFKLTIWDVSRFVIGGLLLLSATLKLHRLLTAAPLALYLIVLLVFNVGCQKPNAKAVEKPGAPRDDYRARTISLPPVFIDEQQYLNVDVPFHNPTETQVTFTKIVKSCSCSDAEAERMTLNPNETLNVKVGIRLLGRLGPSQFTVGLQRDNGELWARELRVNILQRDSWKTPTEYFGPINAGEAPVRDLVFTSYRKEKDELPPDTRFVTNAPALTVIGAEKTVTFAPDVGCWAAAYQVRVRVSDDGSVGMASAIITATGTAAAIVPSLAVSWNYRRAHEVSPASAFLTHAQIDQPLLLLISSGNDQPQLEISRVTSDHAQLLDLTNEGMPNSKQQIIKVRLKAMPTELAFAGNLLVFANGVDQPCLRIPYAYFGTSPRTTSESTAPMGENVP